MTINETKLYLLKLAGKYTEKGGDLFDTFDKLVNLISDKKVKEVRPPAEKKDSGKRAYKHTKHYKRKNAGIYNFNGKEYYYIKDHDTYMEVLQALIILDHEDPRMKTVKEACKLAGYKNINDAGIYLINNGFIEKSGHGGHTVWTILKNPDGTDYNYKAPIEIKVLPAGKAQGYGDKPDSIKYNPTYKGNAR